MFPCRYSENITPIISKFPLKKELTEMVDLWKAQFYTGENNEFLETLISSINKLIFIEGNKLFKKGIVKYSHIRIMQKIGSQICQLKLNWSSRKRRKNKQNIFRYCY